MCGWRIKSGRNLLLPLAAFALILGGCDRPSSTAAKPAASSPRSLRLSQRNEPGDLDVVRATLPDEFALLRALGEGLLVPGPAGSEPQPGAALGFEVSPDGRTYTFRLRPEGRWSNGEPVTAADFVAAYRRVLEPTTAATKAHVFFGVEGARAFATGATRDFATVGIHATGPLTLAITLEYPTSSFPRVVASGPWIPTFPRAAPNALRSPATWVGNGPYVLAEWKPHQHLIVRRNARWHGAAGVAVEEIRFVHFDDGDAEERAYRAGQIDATMAVPTAKLATYAKERPAELHRAPMIETRYLAFNVLRPPLDRPAVRRALALALDRQKLVELVLRGGQIPAGRMLPPALQTDAVPSSASHTLDPVQARELMAAAGFPAGKGFPRMELSGWSNPAILEAIQAMWRRELGVEVALLTRDAKVHLAALAAGSFDIGFVTVIPDIADAADLLAPFRSPAPDNYAHWRDPEFDAALAAGGREPNQLTKAEERLLLSAAVTPLYFNVKNWLMSPRVRGWQEDGLWARSYPHLSLHDN
jgi:oligopeptide transport system substrate-binding protein